MIAYPEANFAPGKADASTNLVWPRECIFVDILSKNVGILALRAAADSSLGLGQAHRHSLLSAHFQHRSNTLASLVHHHDALNRHDVEHRFLPQLPLHLPRDSSGLLDQRQDREGSLRKNAEAASRIRRLRHNLGLPHHDHGRPDGTKALLDDTCSRWTTRADGI